ncbi:hypothetical protein Cfor_06719, partial [Coptotermes formosanus]
MALRHKVTLYKMVIRPIITYCAPVFGHISNEQMLTLQKIQNRFIRIAADVYRFQRNVDLHRDLNLPSIKSVFKTQCRAFFERAETHPNPLI